MIKPGTDHSPRFRFVKPVSVVKSVLPPRNKSSCSPTLKTTKRRHRRRPPRSKAPRINISNRFYHANFHQKIVHARILFHEKINKNSKWTKKSFTGSNRSANSSLRDSCTCSSGSGRILLSGIRSCFPTSTEHLMKLASLLRRRTSPKTPRPLSASRKLPKPMTKFACWIVLRSLSDSMLERGTDVTGNLVAS